jgi:hypothetical protein
VAKNSRISIITPAAPEKSHLEIQLHILSDILPDILQKNHTGIELCKT